MSNPYQPPSDQPTGQPYPQQGYPQQGYPQQNPQQAYPAGAYGSADQAPVTAGSAPTTVTAAFFIYLATALLSLISIVVALNSDIWDQAVSAGVSTTDTGLTTEQLVSITKGAVIGIGVISLGVYLLFAFKMRAGRNWARITLTVFSAFSLLTTVNSTSSMEVGGRVYSSSASQVTGWVGALLALAAIVLMYMPASNEYFRTLKAQRMQQKLQQYQR